MRVCVEQPVHVTMTVGIGLDLYREGRTGAGRHKTELMCECVE